MADEPPISADRAADHVIVCGLRGLGLRIAELLVAAGVGVVVLDDDPDPRLVGIVARWGIPLVQANPRLGEGLLDAGLERARAVICVERDDLASLETALLVRQLVPERRVVVQIANPAVGNAIGEVLGPGTVLDTAALSAPSIIELCLQRTVRDYVLGGERFIVAQVPASPRAATGRRLRDLFGNLAPIAVAPVGDDELIVCPGRDQLVAPGDVVTLVGTAADLDLEGISVDTARDEGDAGLGRRGERRPRRAHRAVAAVLEGADRPLQLVLAALVLLFFVSTLVLRFGYHAAGQPGAERGHLDLVEAAYFTIVTMATVGFGDYHFGGQSTWLVVYGVCLIVTGVALVTTAFALFTNLLVSRRIAESLGRQRLTGLAGHRIVVGLGSVGMRVVEGLVQEGCEVVVVERDEQNRYLSRVRALGAHVLVADATQRQTLDSANLASAASIAVLTSNDLNNIETGLAATALLQASGTAIPIVLRVFDRVLAGTIETTFGFHEVRSTAELAAPWFVGAALGLEIIGTFYVGRRTFLVGRLSISSGSGLEGLAMQELPARTRVVAISRAGRHELLEHPPRRGTRFGAGDQAYIVGPYEELLEVLLRDRRAGPGTSADCDDDDGGRRHRRAGRSARRGGPWSVGSRTT